MNPSAPRAPEIAMPPDTPGVRALKIAIVVMGAMIVLGLMTIIGRMVYLASAGGKQGSSLSSSSTRLAPNAKLTLPPGAHVKHVAVSGDRLVVHYESAGGSGIAVLDLATGNQASRVEIVPEVPR